MGRDGHTKNGKQSDGFHDDGLLWDVEHISAEPHGS
jgi:hypothetical protein